MRGVDIGELARQASDASESLYTLSWTELPPVADLPAPKVAQLGEVEVALIDETTGYYRDSPRYRDLAALMEAVNAGAPVPQVVVSAAPSNTGDDLSAATRTGVYPTLDLLQEWLTHPQLQASRLVILSHNALAMDADEIPDLAAAAAHALVCSAANEHPGRFRWIDFENSTAGEAAPLDFMGLTDALGLGAALGLHGEPTLALRGGNLFVPRLTHASESPPAATGPVFDPETTVLITGATGALGMTLARHLATAHQCRHLLLVSRRGAEAPGVEELRAELAGLGCAAEFAAVDVSDADRLAAAIAAIDPRHPLGAVIHTAGVLADALLEDLDRDHMEQVLRPKIDAAVNLHRLTADHDLTAFVLFSSAAGVLGNPGQANYAAANAALDALAALRHRQGLPAVSLAWGLWEQASAMTSELDQRDRSRLHRMGIAAMSSDHALDLFDQACTRPEPVLVPARLNTQALQKLARAGMLPSLLSTLVSTPASQTSPGSWAHRIADLSPTAQHSELLTEVRGHIAAVLNHPSPETVHPTQPFTDLGLDSLTAVELRNRLTHTTGLPLPVFLIFDHGTPTALTAYLLSQLAPDVHATPSVEETMSVEETVSVDEAVPVGNAQPVLDALPIEESGSAAEAAALVADQGTEQVSATRAVDSAAMMGPETGQHRNLLQRFPKGLGMSLMRPSLAHRLGRSWRDGVDLRGKRILITGASSGIGEIAADLLAEQGAVVIAVARRQWRLQDLVSRIEARGGQAHALPCDLSNVDEINQLIETVDNRFGGVDILVNNAGISIWRPLLESLDRWHDIDRVMQLNYYAPLRLIRAFAPGMVQRNDGHIVNVSSWAVYNQALSNFSAYNASKAALSAICRVIDTEWAKHGVHQTSLYYPLVKTPMIGPNKAYQSVPALTAEEAAGWILTAARERPVRIAPRIAVAAKALDTVSPPLLNALMRRWDALLGTGHKPAGARNPKGESDFR